MANKKGFTIVEMAVVLVIIGVIISASVASIQALQKSALVKEAKQLTALADAQIVEFFSIYSRLPTQSEFQTLPVHKLITGNGQLSYTIPSKWQNYSQKNQYCVYLTDDTPDSAMQAVIDPVSNSESRALFAFYVDYTLDGEIIGRTFKRLGNFMLEAGCKGNEDVPLIVANSLPTILDNHEYAGYISVSPAPVDNSSSNVKLCIYVDNSTIGSFFNNSSTTIYTSSCTPSTFTSSSYRLAADGDESLNALNNYIDRVRIVVRVVRTNKTYDDTNRNTYYDYTFYIPVRPK